jgi:hypothetical protein
LAEPDLDRIFVAGSADQAGLAAFVLDECIEPHRRAINAEIGVRHDLGRTFAEILGDQFHAFFDGTGRIGGSRERLEQAHIARSIGEDEIGESTAGVNSQTIFCTHRSTQALT